MINLFKPILWCWRFNNDLRFSGCWSINWVIIISYTDIFYDDYCLIKRLKSMSHYTWKSTWKWRHAQIVSALFVKGKSSLCMIFYKKASVKNFTKIDISAYWSTACNSNKKDSSTGVFLWILRNYSETFLEEHLRRLSLEGLFRTPSLKFGLPDS